jgi:hypothetical protein
LWLQVERQTINRAARIDQQQEVTVMTLYLTGTVNDAHKAKHIMKSDLSILITRDANIDDLYKDKLSEIRKLENKFLNNNNNNNNNSNNNNDSDKDFFWNALSNDKNDINFANFF